MNATLDTGTSQLQLPPSVALPILNLVNAEYVATPFEHWTVACALPPTVAKSTLSFQFGAASTTTNSTNNSTTTTGPNIKIPLSDLVLPASAFSTSSKGKDTGCIFGITNGTFGDSYGWIFGDPFLRAAYMVVNLEDNVVGLAQSNV